MEIEKLFKVTSVLLLCVFLSAVSAKAQLLADWRFDEGTSGYVCTDPGCIIDSSGNNLNGYGVGSLPPSYVAGCVYDDNIAALHFTTGDDEVWIPDSPSLAFQAGTSFTVEAIIRSAATSFGTDRRGIVVKRNAAGDGGFWLRANGSGDKLNASVGDLTGRTTLDGKRDIIDQQWHHVAMVYDAVAHTLTLYVDHQVDGTTAAVHGDIITIDPPNTPVIVGGWYTTTAGQQWNGDIDMVRITVGALTPAEFVQFSAGACCQNDGTCANTLDSGCSGHWYGPGTTCDGTTCPILGACCQLDGTCSETTQAACNGHWSGPGTGCTGTTCLGACCGNDGTCSDTAANACAGSWGGYGTSCATTDCTGACCLPDGTCAQTTADACTGEWQGPGTTCATVSCTGACCADEGSCSETTQANCPTGWQGSGSHCTTGCPPTPIGYWTFNELPAGSSVGTTAGSVLDVSGHGLDGTSGGNPAPTYVTGASTYANDTALRFVSGTGGVSIPDSNALDFAAGMSVTIEAMVRSTSLTGNRYIVYKRAPSSSGSVRPGFWFRTIAKTVNGVAIQGLEGIIIGTGGNDRISGTINVADGLWHHVAMVYNATATPQPTLAVYVDYQLDGSIPCVCSGASCGVINNSVPMVIGTSGVGDTSGFWPGDIDFVRMTGQALAPAQFIRPQVVATGACCHSDGTCSVTTLEACDGQWNGANTTCETVTCPQPGACCLGDGTCVVTQESACAGTFFGPGTTCDQVDCTGACCQFDGTCADVGQAQCVGQWRGLGTSCDDQICVAQGQTIGYWKFSEATSGNAGTDPGSIIDSSGNGLGGAGVGSPTPSYLPGSPNYLTGPALNFTSGKDAISIPDHPLLDFNDGVSFTVEAVIRTTSTDGARYIVGKRGLASDLPATRPSFWLRTVPKTTDGVATATLGAYLYDVKGGHTSIVGNVSIADGLWHHVAMAYDAAGDKVTLYVDYQLDVTDICYRSDFSNSAPLYIGDTYPSSTSGSWSGDIDFVRIIMGAVGPDKFIQRQKNPDFDQNGMVDHTDLELLLGCVTGPAVGPPTSACEQADLDSDMDVDQLDFGLFQRCYGGPATENCMN